MSADVTGPAKKPVILEEDRQVVVVVDARDKFTQIFYVDSTGQKYGGEISWFFEETFGYDINFSVIFQVEGKEGNAKIPPRYVKIPSRCVTNKGVYVTSPGVKSTVTVIWDNTFSMFTSKTIKYSVKLVPPAEREMQVQRDREEMEKRRQEEDRKKKEEQAKREEAERIEREKREEQERLFKEAKEAAELEEKIVKELTDVVETATTEKKNWTEQATVVDEKLQEAVKIVSQQFQRLKNELVQGEQLWVGNMEDRVKRVHAIVDRVKNDDDKKKYLDQLNQVSALIHVQSHHQLGAFNN